MRGARGALVIPVLAVPLGGCTTERPPADDVEPAMQGAVTAVVAATGADVPVRRELFPHCGPTDERLEGLDLRLLAAPVPRDPDVALDDGARALRERRLGVTRGDGVRDPLLTAAPADGRWGLEVWPAEDGLRVVATAAVDDASATDERPLTGVCG